MRILIFATAGIMAVIGHQQRSLKEEAKPAAMPKVEIRETPIEIRIGQPFSDLKAALDKDVTKVWGSLGARRLKPDEGGITIVLDEAGLELLVYYSLSRDEVTKLRVYVPFPKPKSGREFKAKSLTLHKDGTYSIRFARPQAPQRRQGRSEPKSVPNKSGQQTSKPKR